MASPRFGIWLIGARGGVSTTTIVGLSALRRRLAPEIGLVSALPPFAGLPLPGWDDFVVGGHEIRPSTLSAEAEQLHQQSRVFDPQTLAVCREDFDAIDNNIRPGILWNVGETIRSLATDSTSASLDPRQSIERIQADLAEFREQHELADVVVVNPRRNRPPTKPIGPQPGRKPSRCSTNPTAPCLPVVYTRSQRWRWASLISTSPLRWVRPLRESTNWPASAAPVMPGVMPRRARLCSRACWPRCLLLGT